MRLLLLSVVLAALSPAWTSTAWGWGDTGHKIVCEIAFREAAPETRDVIKDLIRADGGFARFADACTWPDHPRLRAVEHFVNLPRRATALPPNDECPLADKCVVSAIDHERRVLASPGETRQRRAEALKFLGHWVGDIHQPLHVSFRDDRGGNSIEVEGGCQGDLHGAWDTCIVEQALGRDISSITTNLIAEITAAERAAWVSSGPVEWANESFRIVTLPATRYCVMEEGVCSYEEGNAELDPDEPEKVIAVDSAYFGTNGPIISDRLKRAGMRLADLLDRMLKP